MNPGGRQSSQNGGGRFNPTPEFTRVPTASTISIVTPSPTSHANACKSAEMKRIEGNLSDLGCEWNEENRVFKVSPLWCLCRQGNIHVVRWILQNKQVKLDGAQDQLHGRTLLHAAHVSGEFEIVALLLLAGAVPSKDNSALLPADYTCLGNNFQKKEMIKLWRTYSKGGTERIALDFPHLASTITVKITAVGDKGITEINNYIRTHQKLPNLQGKVPKVIGKIGETLNGTLEQLLLHYRFKIVDGEDHPTSLKEVYERYLQTEFDEDITASTKERSKPSIIQAATDIWNVNITIILYSTSQMKVSLKRYYVNKFYKKNYPTIYMTYDGVRFDYLVDETTHNTTHDTLFTLIETPASTQEDFVTALNYFDPSKINEYQEHRVVDRDFKMKMTLLYYACRLGRSDIVQQLLAIDGINPNLGESRDKNTPLHVASWRGFYNIVVMLLYVKADASLKNSANEFPNAVSKEVPEKAKNELQRIWTIYAKGPETFAQEYQNFVIVDKELSTVTSSITASTTASTNINLLLADKISVEQLCNYVDTENAPPTAEFRQILEKFNNDHINTLSVNHKCTVLYAAVRRGHFDIVEELIKFPKIKLVGSQETYSDSGNTCLHVANWRGHYRIVALLILRGAILEPKKTGNRPNALSEKNFTLDEITRNTLALIYRNSEPVNKELLKEIVETPPPKTNSATGHLPLWAVIGLPKDDLPPQYLKSEYVWYRKTGNETKMTLLPLIQSSHLTAVYLRERKSTKPIEVKMITPPATGLFSNSCSWANENWTIDFTAMTATLKNNTNIKLAAITRSKIWYYSTLPQQQQQQDSPYVPFPSSICNKISAAYSGGMGSLQFPFQMEKGFFAKPATCTIHFAKKEVTINSGATRMTHALLNEDEHYRITFWEPDAFLPRERVVYPPKEVTSVDIPVTSEEGRRICSYFFLTVPAQQNNVALNEIVKIQRLFYPELREKFEQNLSHAQALHSGNPLFANSIQYTRLLWHGTGHTDPMVIAKGGWKINYSSDRNLWGKGSYFASDAAYSATYAFQDKVTGNRKMFLAQVITGLGIQCMENGNIKDVPDGYNSIVGFRHGSWIYITYDNGLAFPTYLVEWRSKN